MKFLKCLVYICWFLKWKIAYICSKNAHVVKLVDTPSWGGGAVRCAGSNPVVGTFIRTINTCFIKVIIKYKTLTMSNLIAITSTICLFLIISCSSDLPLDEKVLGEKEQALKEQEIFFNKIKKNT